MLMAGLSHNFLRCPGMSLSMLVGFVAILDQIIQPYGVLWFLGFYNQKKTCNIFFDTQHLLQHVLIKWLARQPVQILPTLDWFDWGDLDQLEGLENGWKLQTASVTTPKHAKTRKLQMTHFDWKILEICHQPTSGRLAPFLQLKAACHGIGANSGSWIWRNSVRASVSMSCSSLEPGKQRILMIWGWVKTLVPSEPQNSW